jgi:hypothetical protein
MPLARNYVVATRCNAETGPGWIIHGPDLPFIVTNYCTPIEAREDRYCCPESEMRVAGVPIPSVRTTPEESATPSPALSALMDSSIGKAVSDGIDDILGQATAATPSGSVVKDTVDAALNVITGQKTEDRDERSVPLVLYAVGGLVAVGGAAALGWWLWKGSK